MLDYVPACHSENKELGEYRNFLRSIGIDVDNYWARVTGSYSKDAKKLQLNPYELGWGWLVNFNHDFIGKAALLKIKQSGPSKQVSFVWNKEDVIDVFASFFRDETYEQMELPRANGGGLVASTVQKDGQTIGFATSRCYSSYFKVMLSLGVISPEHSKPGNEVEIVWGEEGRPQKIIRAVRARPLVPFNSFWIVSNHRVNRLFIQLRTRKTGDERRYYSRRLIPTAKSRSGSVLLGSFSSSSKTSIPSGV